MSRWLIPLSYWRPAGRCSECLSHEDLELCAHAWLKHVSDDCHEDMCIASAAAHRKAAERLTQSLCTAWLCPADTDTISRDVTFRQSKAGLAALETEQIQPPFPEDDSPAGVVGFGLLPNSSLRGWLSCALWGQTCADPFELRPSAKHPAQ